MDPPPPPPPPSGPVELGLPLAEVAETAEGLLWEEVPGPISVRRNSKRIGSMGRLLHAS